MKPTERKKMILIHIPWILALAVILCAPFTHPQNHYPASDDWFFRKYMEPAIPAGEGMTGVIPAI